MNNFSPFTGRHQPKAITYFLILWLELIFCQSTYARTIQVFELAWNTSSGEQALPLQIQLYDEEPLSKQQQVIWHAATPSYIEVCANQAIHVDDFLRVNEHAEPSGYHQMLFNPAQTDTPLVIKTDGAFIPCDPEWVTTFTLLFAQSSIKRNTRLIMDFWVARHWLNDSASIIPGTNSREGMLTTGTSFSMGFNNKPPEKPSHAMFETSDMPIDIVLMKGSADTDQPSSQPGSSSHSSGILRVVIDGLHPVDLPLWPEELVQLTRLLENPNLFLKALSGQLRNLQNPDQTINKLLHFVEQLGTLSPSPLPERQQAFISLLVNELNTIRVPTLTVNLEKAFDTLKNVHHPVIHQLPGRGDESTPLLPNYEETVGNGDKTPLPNEELSDNKALPEKTNGDQPGGSDNSENSAPSAPEKASEADLLEAQLNLLNQMLQPHDWLSLGVAMELPLTDLMTIPEQHVSPLNALFQQARLQGALTFDRFIRALKFLNKEEVVSTLTDAIVARAEYHRGALEDLAALDRDTLVYQYENGLMSGGAIVDFAHHYGPMTTVGFTTPMAEWFRRIQSNPVFKFKVLPMIVQLLQERSVNRLNYQYLRSLVPEWGTYERAERYQFASQETLVSLPPQVSDEGSFESRETSKEAQNREAETLLRNKYVKLLEEWAPEDNIQLLHFALGVPLHELRAYLRKAPEKHLGITLTAARQHGLLTFQNLLVALNLAGFSDARRHLTNQLLADGHITQALVDALGSIQRADLLRHSGGRTTSLVLVELHGHLGSLSLTRFRNRINDISVAQPPSLHDAFSQLSTEDDQLHGQTGSLALLFEWVSDIARNDIVTAISGLTGFSINEAEPTPSAPVINVQPFPQPSTVVHSQPPVEIVTVTVTPDPAEPPPEYQETDPLLGPKPNEYGVITQQPSTYTPHVPEPTPEPQSCLGDCLN